MSNIKQVQSVDAINEALESGFYQTIYDCFSVPPFSEIITREKVNYYFHKYVNQGVLYLACETGIPIGFVATLPLIKTKNIGELSFIDTWVYYQSEKICLRPEFFTQKTQLSLDKHQYIASLAVDPKFRRRGTARQLFQTLFSHFDSTVAYVLRTTNNPNYAYIPKFYQNLGFKMLPLMEKIDEQNRGNPIDNQRLVGIKYPNNTTEAKR